MKEGAEKEPNDRLDRRKFITGAAALALVRPEKAESSEISFNILPSNLSEQRLELQKSVAIASLTKDIPNDPKFGYLRSHVSHLEQESQMYIPSRVELGSVIEKGRGAINELASHIQVGRYGLFAYADANEKEKSRAQRLYVLKRNDGNEIEFVKGYRVSMSESGFGNDKDSGKTPLGIHSIEGGRRGLFGEVVSGLNKHRDMFNHFVVGGKDRWFVKSFGERPAGEQSSDVAEVVTDQYLLKGPNTDVARGIRIHGTNRSGALNADGTWRSFLGGIRRSGGCIRMSNVDVRDLSLSGYIAPPQSVDINGDMHGIHTPVMIFATETGQSAIHFPEDESSHPKRWVHPTETPQAAAAEEAKIEEAVQTQKTEHPKRWISPNK